MTDHDANPQRPTVHSAGARPIPLRQKTDRENALPSEVDAEVGRAAIEKIRRELKENA